MMYREFRSEKLSHLIQAIWYSDSNVDPDEGHVVSPTLGSQLVIKLYESDFETVLSGPTTQQKQYPYVAGAHYFGIQFVPNAGFLFDAFALKDLRDDSIDVGQILNIDLSQLAYQLHALNHWHKQSALIETAVCQKYPDDSRFLNQNILFAMDIANKCDGNITIKQLAMHVGVSRRHLERLFLNHTGVTPKTFCTVLRIHKVLDHLSLKHPLPLAQLALECGYVDQSHMANDFRQIMGTSIKHYQNQK